MSVPGIVQSALDGEEIAARVSLGGEDELFVTAARTIIYRAEGLLSDESIDEFPHDAERLTLSEGRRKSRFSLEYPLEDEKEFTVPASKTESVLHPVLAGLLNGNGITDPGETVARTYRFSELTVIVTSDRLVKHIGAAVWDGDFEQYEYGEVTGLSFEDGSVATQVVIEVDGRPQRIKAPNESAGDLSERLKRALCTYHAVETLEELNEKLSLDEDDEEPTDPAAAFGEGVEPLEANPPELDSQGGIRRPDETASERAGNEERVPPAREPATAGQTHAEPPATDVDDDEQAAAAADASADGFEGSGFEPITANVDAELLERLDALEATVAAQNDLLERHQATIELLIEELRQGR
ncbi:DUF7115 domain-containing protein [Natronobiforma cellulositropha]|uniref:DUF7115 domain-containing protein n=1 Tax=Natronobiforma cellulositropha TaxID=1679076 RepID=UPI0021D5A11D|nr:hypothetical protein [Natronobiforma cellulositropha]